MHYFFQNLGVSIRGLCFSTWSCEEFPGVQNSSLMPFEQCCANLWGLSWKNASDQTCLSCSYTLLPGKRISVLIHCFILWNSLAESSLVKYLQLSHAKIYSVLSIQYSTELCIIIKQVSFSSSRKTVKESKAKYGHFYKIKKNND